MGDRPAVGSATGCAAAATRGHVAPLVLDHGRGLRRRDSDKVTEDDWSLVESRPCKKAKRWPSVSRGITCALPVEQR
jgi:hypothetical protein